jgi:hypothetical protein
MRQPFEQRSDMTAPWLLARSHAPPDRQSTAQEGVHTQQSDSFTPATPAVRSRSARETRHRRRARTRDRALAYTLLPTNHPHRQGALASSFGAHIGVSFYTGAGEAWASGCRWWWWWRQQARR